MPPGTASNARFIEFPQQAPGSGDDDDDDRKACDRVEPQPAGEADRERGKHHAERDRRIAGHMQEGAADVEIVLAAAHEQPAPWPPFTTIPAAATAITVLSPTGWGRRAAAPPPARSRRRQQQHHRVRQRRQDRAAAPAVGARAASEGGAPSQAARPGQQQAQHVAKVVGGVGQQRHANWRRARRRSRPPRSRCSAPRRWRRRDHASRLD